MGGWMGGRLCGWWLDGWIGDGRLGGWWLGGWVDGRMDG